MCVKKAVIPVAGLGTRFLPATKAVPKEMLPIVDVPTIQYIVKEAVASGIKEIILVTGKGKGSIIDHFDAHSDLESKLEKAGKHELLELVRETNELATVVAIRQKAPLGLGHAVLCAKELVGKEPFLVMLGDDLVDATKPCSRQMIDVYNEHKKSVVALMPVEEEDVNKFGICGGKRLSQRVIDLDSMVEKPALEQAPSNLAIVGRYILTPDIFEYLENTKPGKGGEIQLTDAMSRLMADKGFLGYEFEGYRYDAGDRFGYLQANIAFGLKRKDLAPRLMAYMKSLVEAKE